MEEMKKRITDAGDEICLLKSSREIDDLRRLPPSDSRSTQTSRVLINKIVGSN